MAARKRLNVYVLCIVPVLLDITQS
jgi:hypothetical protein